ncbi:MAG: B12-binding domain-containing radical SAM protein [Thermoleophilia bacterium]
MYDVLLIDVPITRKRIPSLYAGTLARKMEAHASIRNARLGPLLTAGQNLKHYSPGLLYLAGALRQDGFSVGYANCTYQSLESIDNMVRESRVAAVTCTTPAASEVLSVSRRVKSINPDAVVVLGGPHATHCDEQLLRSCEAIDVIVRGEGEQAICEIAADPGGYKRMAGVSYRQEEDVVRAPDRPRLSGERIPLPAYDILPGKLEDYYLTVITSRGCPNSCVFCADSRRSVVFRRNEAVIRELQLIRERLSGEGSYEVHFADSIFTLGEFRTLELCHLLRHTFGNYFQFVCDAMPPYLSTRVIEALAVSNFKMVCLGFESRSSIYRKGARNSTFEEYERASKTLEAAGILVLAYWLTGLPGSTWSSFSEDARVIHDLVETGTVSMVSNKILVPYPGTPLFSHPEEYGATIMTSDWSQYDRYSPPVFRLDTASEQLIYASFLYLEEVLIASYAERLGVSFTGGMAPPNAPQLARYLQADSALSDDF